MTAAQANPRVAPASLITLWGPGHPENPFPIYAELRQQAPASLIYHAANRKPMWVVTRYDAVESMLKDERFSVDKRRAGFAEPRLQRWVSRLLGMDGDSLVSVDDPEHYRLRNLVQRAFTPRTIDKLQGWIDTTANRLLDAAIEKNDIDLIAEFALPLPLMVIAELLGVPDAERNEFSGLMSDLFNFAMPRANVLSTALSGYRLRRYLGKLIELRRRNPDERLLSAMIAAEESGDHLTEAELTVMLLLLLFAGHETTVNLIGNGMLALLENPEQFALLREQPQLAASAVEELLRFAPPVEYGMPRYALADIQIEDTVIPRGAEVIALLSAANRDERAYVDPDSLDITREKNRHATFGFGAHFCLGAALARMEGTIALRALAQRCPDIALTNASTKLEWWSVAGLRGMKKLPIQLR